MTLTTPHERVKELLFSDTYVIETEVDYLDMSENDFVIEITDTSITWQQNKPLFTVRILTEDLKDFVEPLLSYFTDGLGQSGNHTTKDCETPLDDFKITEGVIKSYLLGSNPFRVTEI